MGVKVRQHTRTLSGRRKRGRGFTIVFRLDITPIRHGRRPVEKMYGSVYEVFALRTLAKDEAAALAQVSREYNYPEILAALADPSRNLYHAANAIAAAGVGGLQAISKAAAQVKKGKRKGG